MGTKELALAAVGGVATSFLMQGLLVALKQSHVIPGIPTLMINLDIHGYGWLDGNTHLQIGIVEDLVGLIAGIVLYRVLAKRRSLKETVSVFS